jgi:hypothetical protein
MVGKLPQFGCAGGHPGNVFAGRLATKRSVSRVY